VFRRRATPPAPSRLARAAPALAERLRTAPPDRQRAAAASAATLAVRTTGLADAVIDRALRSLTANAPVPPDVRAAVAVRLIALDQQAWQLQDLVEEGRESPANQAVAFARARACNAVERALVDDPATAAAEATYEAFIATDDLPALERALADIVG